MMVNASKLTGRNDVTLEMDLKKVTYYFEIEHCHSTIGFNYYNNADHDARNGYLLKNLLIRNGGICFDRKLFITTFHRKKGKYYGLGKFAEPLILTRSRRAPLWCGICFGANI
ncbi:unnamed protein product [Prunus armeniaca]|uniref:Uncharacterized protein n=1 Tax=Prunus armeniaca TaxID=36596 RepID=A0A6J5XVV8_PRUAR|nr:unnamed protein product [Prunus armeniaca]